MVIVWGMTLSELLRKLQPVLSVAGPKLEGLSQSPGSSGDSALFSGECVFFPLG
jgi:hypothetical protein